MITFLIQSLREASAVSRAPSNRSQRGEGAGSPGDSQDLDHARAVEDLCIRAFELAGRARLIGLTRVSLMLESAALEAACDTVTSRWPTDG
jgi:hypothetical protein